MGCASAQKSGDHEHHHKLAKPPSTTLLVPSPIEVQPSMAANKNINVLACSKNVVILFSVELLSVKGRCRNLLKKQHVLERFVIGNTMNSVDVVDFGSIPTTTIHQKEETLEKIVPARQILQQQILIEATSLPRRLTHLLWMGLGFLRVHVKDDEFWSGVPVPEPQCRDLGFGIDSLASGLGRFRKVLESFDVGRRIDELKEQKAAIIVEESDIEGELWWDLSSIDKLMSRSLVSWQDLW
ncbi:hypothetical protein NC651_022856 [Populus alba x Populus x berolinensis]|nr:hypothetical protein NC651_022856 [Populus alba x Populus x berolinensis]